MIMHLISWIEPFVRSSSKAVLRSSCALSCHLGLSLLMFLRIAQVEVEMKASATITAI